MTISSSFAPLRKQMGVKGGNPRNVTYFHPPYSLNVKTNVGARFLKLIDSCFPPLHPLAKILNRNTVKMGYCCMPNMGQAINKHNSKIAKQGEEQQPTPGCNCRGGVPTCPVGGACQTEVVVYQDTVTREDNNTAETYTGLTSRRFKDRWYEHTQDISHQKREGTGLSHFVWKLKEKDVPHKIEWKLLMKSQSFNTSRRTCYLCLKEKFCIMFRPEGASLNSRSEFFQPADTG